MQFELAGQGSAHSFEIIFKPGCKCVPGANRPAKQVQSFREVFFKFAKPAFAYECHDRIGSSAAIIPIGSE